MMYPLIAQMRIDGIRSNVLNILSFFVAVDDMHRPVHFSTVLCNQLILVFMQPNFTMIITALHNVLNYLVAEYLQWAFNSKTNAMPINLILYLCVSKGRVFSQDCASGPHGCKCICEEDNVSHINSFKAS